MKTETCPSRLQLASWEQSVPGAEDNSSFDDHVATCDRCKSIVEEIKTNTACYNENKAGHAEKLREIINREPVSITPQKKYNHRVALPLAAAALICIGLLMFRNGPAPDTSTVTPNETALQPAIMYKGSFSMSIVAQRDNSQFIVGDSEKLQAGDAIRVVVETGSSGHLRVLMLTDKEAQILYPNPDDSEPLLRIAQPGRLELQGAFEMDEAPGRHRVVAGFSNTPFSATAFDDAAKQEKPSMEGVEFRVVSITKR